jgi:outer membrane immunogenic protein
MKQISLILLTGASLLAVDAALAADFLPTTKSAPYLAPPPPPSFSWTGCHVGLRGGVGVGQTSWQDVNVPGDIDALGFFNTANTNQVGGLIGAQAGCDYQFGGPWVIGAETMFDLSNVDGQAVDEFNNTWSLKNTTQWLGSTTARAGWAVDRMLLYGRGGVAYAQDRLAIENSGENIGITGVTRLGWTLGGGAEWAFAPNMSVFAEGDYYQFGAQNVNFVGNLAPPAMNGPFTVKTSQSVEAFQFGVNFHF